MNCLRRGLLACFRSLSGVEPPAEGQQCRWLFIHERRPAATLITLIVAVELAMVGLFAKNVNPKLLTCGAGLMLALFCGIRFGSAVHRYAPLIAVAIGPFLLASILFARLWTAGNILEMADASRAVVWVSGYCCLCYQPLASVLLSVPLVVGLSVSRYLLEQNFEQPGHTGLFVGDICTLALCMCISSYQRAGHAREHGSDESDNHVGVVDEEAVSASLRSQRAKSPNLQERDESRSLYRSMYSRYKIAMAPMDISPPVTPTTPMTPDPSIYEPGVYRMYADTRMIEKMERQPHASPNASLRARTAVWRDDSDFLPESLLDGEHLPGFIHEESDDDLLIAPRVLKPGATPASLKVPPLSLGVSNSVNLQHKPATPPPTSGGSLPSAAALLELRAAREGPNFSTSFMEDFTRHVRHMKPNKSAPPSRSPLLHPRARKATELPDATVLPIPPMPPLPMDASGPAIEIPSSLAFSGSALGIRIPNASSLPRMPDAPEHAVRLAKTRTSPGRDSIVTALPRTNVGKGDRFEDTKNESAGKIPAVAPTADAAGDAAQAQTKFDIS